MSKVITNIKTGIVIDNDSIVDESTAGILVKNYDCIKFIPAADLEIEEKADDGVYSKNEAGPEFDFARTLSSSDSYIDKAEYTLGFNNLVFSNVKYYKNSAIISDSIDVSNYSYVTLSVEENGAYNSSVEYSILDGANEEVAILPENINYVTEEKLFYGLPTRFIVNSSQQEPILYEDGQLSSRSYKSLDLEDFESHEYRLNYLPGGKNINKYTPINNSIKIKIIIRNFTDTFSPVRISNIQLHLFGEF